MATARHSSQSSGRSEIPDIRRLGRRVAVILRAAAAGIAAGWRASVAYRRASRMSDGELARRGMSRADIARDIERRYFAGLGGGRGGAG